MKVQCSRHGVVTLQFCGRCSDWVYARQPHPYGNSPNTCDYFREIIHDEQPVPKFCTSNNPALKPIQGRYVDRGGDN